MTSNMTHISPTLQSKLYIEKLKQEGKNIYNFGLGENNVNQSSFYVNKIKEYAHKKEYGSSEGVIELNQTLKKMYNNDKVHYDILVGNGLKELLFIVQCAFNGKIIHITPSWVSYKEHIDMLNKNDDLIEFKTNIENNFRINLNKLEDVLRNLKDVPKLMILNNPNNPTGMCYNNDELYSLGLLLKQYNCLVFSDEIYLNLCYSPNQKSIYEYIPQLTIRGSSVSKDLACGGYRIGWCAFPENLKPFFTKCCNFGSRIYSNVSSPIQYATNDMLNNKELCKIYIEETMNLYKYISNKVLESLKGKKLLYVKTEAAWYVFIDFRNYEEELKKINVRTSIELSQYLMKNYQIITVAGEHFNHDSLSLRFSFVDFEFNFEDKIPIEDVNIDNMLNGIKQLHLFLDDICK
tara:strand:+ start:6080 stop:7297 length:1218 start_codon:yes stop_codon:yes gene_type:complete